MRSYWGRVSLSNMTGVFIGKKRHREEGRVKTDAKTEADIRVSEPQAEESQGLPEAGSGRKDLSLDPIGREQGLLTTWPQTSSFRTVRE